MKTTWHVTKVTATETTVTAELVRREWFKKNPAYVAMMDEYDDMIEQLGQEETDRVLAERGDQPFIDEFLDAEPGEAGADFLDTSDTMKLELPDDDDQQLAAGDDVFLELTVVAEPADA